MTQNELKRIYTKEPLSDGIIIILLDIVTCGFYSIYWMYKTCQVVDDIYYANGVRTTDTTVLFVLLGFFLTPVVYYALMQDKINNLIDSIDGTYYPGNI